MTIPEELRALYARFQLCNRTELYQRCMRSGRTVRPTATKEELILTLLGLREPEDSIVDHWRDAQMRFVIEHWEVLRPQIVDCPASTKSPKACHSCIDMRVAACLSIRQKDNLEEIERYARGDNGS